MTENRPRPVAEGPGEKIGGVYCGHRYPEPGCTGCGYEFPPVLKHGVPTPVRGIDREQVAPVPVEHDPLCYDGPLAHDSRPGNECTCPCHDEPWTQARLKKARSRAQTRAKTQLSHEFKWRYRELYYAALKLEGLTVVHPDRMGARRHTLARERQVHDE